MMKTAILPVPAIVVRTVRLFWLYAGLSLLALMWIAPQTSIVILVLAAIGVPAAVLFGRMTWLMAVGGLKVHHTNEKQER